MDKSVSQYLNQRAQQDSIELGEYYFGPRPPPSPIEGDVWWDTSEKRLKLYTT